MNRHFDEGSWFITTGAEIGFFIQKASRSTATSDLGLSLKEAFSPGQGAVGVVGGVLIRLGPDALDLGGDRDGLGLR